MEFSLKHLAGLCLITRCESGDFQGPQSVVIGSFANTELSAEEEVGAIGLTWLLNFRKSFVPFLMVPQVLTLKRKASWHPAT